MFMPRAASVGKSGRIEPLCGVENNLIDIATIDEYGADGETQMRVCLSFDVVESECE